MALEDLIKSLEAKLPGFSYTVFSQAPGMPVMLRWDHRSPALQKREAVLVRSIVAQDVKTGFEQILARYERFEAEDRLKKQEEDKQRGIALRRAIEAQMPPSPPPKSEQPRRRRKYEGVEDEGVGKPQKLQDVADNLTLKPRSPVRPE